MSVWACSASGHMPQINSTWIVGEQLWNDKLSEVIVGVFFSIHSLQIFLLNQNVDAFLHNHTSNVFPYWSHSLTIFYLHRIQWTLQKNKTAKILHVTSRKKLSLMEVGPTALAWTMNLTFPCKLWSWSTYTRKYKANDHCVPKKEWKQTETDGWMEAIALPLSLI